MSSISSKIITQIIAVLTIVGLICGLSTEAKLLRRSRYYDEPYLNGGGFDGPYASGATGERAIVTVRGARNPYDGSAPSKIIIEDNPYRGAYPRGVYDRLDGGYGRPPIYPRPDYGYSNYGGG